MHAHTLPQTSPALSSSTLTRAGSMWDGSSIGISTDSNPHFLNFGNSFVESFVNGDVNRNVLMPSLIGDGFSKPAAEMQSVWDTSNIPRRSSKVRGHARHRETFARPSGRRTNPI